MEIFHRNIHYFLECARSRSLLEAARKLCVTQASLSLAIQRFEVEMGATLLVRGHFGIRLTTQGEALYKRLSQQVERVHKEVSAALDREDDTPIKMGAPNPFFERVLVPSLDKMSEKPPLVLFSQSSTRLYQAVSEGRLAFAFVNWENEPPGKLAVQKIAPMTTALVALKSKFGHLANTKDLKTLLQYPWITAYREPEYAWSSLLDSTKGGVVVNSVALSRKYILEGRGIGNAEIEYFSIAELKRLIQIPLRQEENPLGYFPNATTYLLHPKQLDSRVENFLCSLMKIVGQDTAVLS